MNDLLRKAARTLQIADEYKKNGQAYLAELRRGSAITFATLAGLGLDGDDEDDLLAQVRELEYDGDYESWGRVHAGPTD